MKTKRSHLIDELAEKQKFSLQLASKKESSSWIQAQPLQHDNFDIQLSMNSEMEKFSGTDGTPREYLPTIRAVNNLPFRM